MINEINLFEPINEECRFYIDNELFYTIPSGSNIEYVTDASHYEGWNYERLYVGNPTIVCNFYHNEKYRPHNLNGPAIIKATLIHDVWIITSFIYGITGEHYTKTQHQNHPLVIKNLVNSIVDL